MRLLARTTGAWLFGIVALAGSAVMADERPAGVVFTRQQSFVLPFHVGEPGQPSAAPAAVELHISEDQGATWHVQAAVPPQKRGFKFKAPCDGEYWFAVRTKDQAGKTWPEGPLAAEMRVTVDTVPPVLDLAAQYGEAGEINAQLRISDPYLRPETLKLDYHADDAPDAWEIVALDPIPADASGPEHYGQVTWWPQVAATGFTVRAQISDAAGNPTVTQIQVASRRAPATYPEPEASEPVLPPANDGQPTAKPVTNSVPWPADETDDGPLTAEQGERATGPASPAAIRPPVGARYNAAAPAEIDDPRQAASLPLGVRPRMVNSLRFRLDYDLESVGPWGVRKVELWGTRDNGRTWVQYGVDADNQSPLMAVVEAEGTYGFRILVQSGSGLVESPPKSGDAPEVWIGVDLSPPVCKVTRIEQGSGERAGQLFVHWEADDAVLAERPVSLSFSQRAGGPWLPVAAGLRNTGRYIWQLDSRVPEQVYLRLEVRDEAGNLAVCEPPEPITVSALRPRGRIRDVHPVSEASPPTGP